MNCHQILSGACNAGDKSFAVGSVEGIPFTVRFDIHLRQATFFSFLILAMLLFYYNKQRIINLKKEMKKYNRNLILTFHLEIFFS